MNAARLDEEIMKKEDLSGQKFGRLTVIGTAEPLGIKSKRTAWLCQCDCGNIKPIKAEHLKDGTTKSCGCLNTENNVKRAYQMHAVNTKYHPSETSARRVWKKRYNDGDLSFEDFMRISQMNCSYCEAEPNNMQNSAASDKKASVFAKENGDFIYNGLDRVDSNKPHNLDNVVPCCFPCNIAKHTMTEMQFKEWIVRVVKHFIKKKLIALGDLFV